MITVLLIYRTGKKSTRSLKFSRSRSKFSHIVSRLFPPPRDRRFGVKVKAFRTLKKVSKLCKSDLYFCFGTIFSAKCKGFFLLSTGFSILFLFWNYFKRMILFFVQRILTRSFPLRLVSFRRKKCYFWDRSGSLFPALPLQKKQKEV